MLNEPVAWAYILDGGDFMDAIHPEEHNKHEGKYTTPLYTHPAKDNYRETHEGFSTVIDVTHPAKTLTAEEINQVAKECKWDYDEMNVVDFARAILRKAQEK